MGIMGEGSGECWCIVAMWWGVFDSNLIIEIRKKSYKNSKQKIVYSISFEESESDYIEKHLKSELKEKFKLDED